MQTVKTSISDVDVLIQIADDISIHDVSVIRSLPAPQGISGGGGGKGDLQKWTAVADSTIWDFTRTYNNTTFAYTANVEGIAYGNNRFVAVGTKIAYADW